MTPSSRILLTRPGTTCLVDTRCTVSSCCCPAARHVPKLLLLFRGFHTLWLRRVPTFCLLHVFLIFFDYPVFICNSAFCQVCFSRFVRSLWYLLWYCTVLMSNGFLWCSASPIAATSTSSALRRMACCVGLIHLHSFKHLSISKHLCLVFTEFFLFPFSICKMRRISAFASFSRSCGTLSRSQICWILGPFLDDESFIGRQHTIAPKIITDVKQKKFKNNFAKNKLPNQMLRNLFIPKINTSAKKITTVTDMHSSLLTSLCFSLSLHLCLFSFSSLSLSFHFHLCLSLSLFFFISVSLSLFIFISVSLSFHSSSLILFIFISVSSHMSLCLFLSSYDLFVSIVFSLILSSCLFLSMTMITRSFGVLSLHAQLWLSLNARVRGPWPKVCCVVSS